MKPDAKGKWVFLADRIDWAAVEAENRAPFQSKRGRPAVSEGRALDSCGKSFGIQFPFRFASFHGPATTYHVVGIEDEAA